MNQQRIIMLKQTFIGLMFSIIFVAPSHAEIIQADGDLITRLAPNSNGNVYYQVAFKTKEPINCNGVEVSHVSTSSPPFNPGNKEVFPDETSFYDEYSQASLFADAGLVIDVEIRHFADHNHRDYSDYLDRDECVVDVKKAIKNVEGLSSPVLLEDNKLAVAVKEIDYFRDPPVTSTLYPRTFALKANEPFDCNGSTTNNLFYQWDDTKSGYNDPYRRVFSRDMFLRSIQNDYVAVSLGEYYQHEYSDVEGCLIIDMRTLTTGELNIVDDNTANSGVFYGQEDLDIAIEEAFKLGIQQCKTDPTSCGLFAQSNIDEAFVAGQEQGVQQCQDDAASCEVFAQTDIDDALVTGKELGVQVCQDDAASCGLFDQEDISDAIVTGEAQGTQQCIDDPESCGVFAQSDIDNAILAGEQQGVQQCIDDPNSCGLFDQLYVDKTVSTEIKQVMNEFISGLPKGQIKSMCKKMKSYYFSKFSVCQMVEGFEHGSHHKKKLHSMSRNDHKKSRWLIEFIEGRWGR